MVISHNLMAEASFYLLADDNQDIDAVNMFNLPEVDAWYYLWGTIEGGG